jgi:hypothetical protein
LLCEVYFTMRHTYTTTNFKKSYDLELDQKLGNETTTLVESYEVCFHINTSVYLSLTSIQAS